MALTMPDIKVSAHAIERYMERSGTKKRTRAENRLKKMLAGAERVEIKDLRKVLAIINHGFQEAAYLKYGGWLLVVCDSTLVTVYSAPGVQTRRGKGFGINEPLE